MNTDLNIICISNNDIDRQRLRQLIENVTQPLTCQWYTLDEATQQNNQAHETFDLCLLCFCPSMNIQSHIPALPPIILIANDYTDEIDPTILSNEAILSIIDIRFQDPLVMDQVLKDATFHHKKMVEQKEIRHKIEKSIETKNDFIAKISHDLRNPLHQVQCISAMLKEGMIQPEKQPHMLDIIQTACVDSLYLLDELLELSRVANRTYTVKPEPLNVSTFVEKLILGQQQIAQEKQINLYADMAEDTPAEIITDRLMLWRILTNILSNSLKFIQKGNIAVVVGRASDSQIYFEINDTGPGIPEKELQTIFKSYHQVRQIHSEGSGIGLGLHIAQEATDLLHGKMSIESSVDVGTSIRLEFPIGVQQPCKAGRDT